MNAINWGLGLGNPALEMFQVGNAMGTQIRQRKEETEQKNALAAYAQNPSEQGLSGLAQTNPLLALQERGRLAEAQRAGIQQKRDELGIISRLLADVGDEETYQQRLAIARQNNIDTSGAPPNFNKPWVDQTRAMVKALQQGGVEALSPLGKIAADEGLVPGTQPYTARVRQLYEIEQSKTLSVPEGGGVAVYNPATGRTEFAITPNTGGAPAGAPAGGIQEGATATNPQTGQKVQFRGGQWVPMGGGASNGTGGFPSGQ